MKTMQGHTNEQKKQTNLVGNTYSLVGHTYNLIGCLNGLRRFQDWTKIPKTCPRSAQDPPKIHQDTAEAPPKRHPRRDFGC